MTAPCKPFKTLDQLCEILIDERGLMCAGRGDLKKFLARTNYYRFSGYAREFQVDPKYGDNRFIGGTTFESIVGIMEADSKMRRLLAGQLSVVEIAIRAAIAHEFGRAHGEKAFYLDTDFYSDGGRPEDDRPLSIVKGFLSDLERNKGGMVSHYVDRSVTGDTFEGRCRRYADVPIWVAVEVASFGRIANMISYVNDIEPAKEAAKTFSIQWDPFAEVVHALCFLRNMCAHHRQLWNRRMDIQCPVQKKLRPRNVKFDSLGPYAHLIMLNQYRLKIDGDTSVAQEMGELLDSNPAYSEGFRNPRPK